MYLALRPQQNFVCHPKNFFQPTPISFCHSTSSSSILSNICSSPFSTSECPTVMQSNDYTLHVSQNQQKCCINKHFCSFSSVRCNICVDYAFDMPPGSNRGSLLPRRAASSTNTRTGTCGIGRKKRDSTIGKRMKRARSGGRAPTADGKEVGRWV